MLAPVAIEALATHKTRQAEERQRLGDEAWHDHDLVFPLQDGTPMDGQSLTRYEFRRLLARAGLPLVRFHDLRHTYATLMFEREIELKKASAALGHSTTAITADLYTHVTTTIQRQLAAVAEAIVQPPATTNPRQGESGV